MNKTIFIGILLVGLVLRILKPTFGFPILYVIPDEVDTHLAAFEMIASRTLTTISYYPPLGSYIQIPFLIAGYGIMRLVNLASSLRDFQLYITTHEGAFLLIPRLLSGIFGAATLPLIYLIALEIFAKHKYKFSIAHWSMFFMAFLGPHLRLSHTGKSWASSVFFGCLSLYFLLRSINHSYKKHFNVIISSLTLAIAGGFHFTAYFLLIPMALIRATQFKLKQLLHKDNLVSFIAISIPVLSFFIYNLLRTTDANYPIYVVGNFQIILRQFSLYNIKNYLENLFFSEPIIATLLFTSLLLINNWGKTLKILVIYASIYFVTFGIGYHPSLGYIHYVLPTFIIFSIMAGLAMSHYLNKSPKIFKPFLIGIIVSGTILPQSFWLYLYHQTPTFIESKNWINQHIDKSTLIAYADVRYVPFIPTVNSIELMQAAGKRPRVYARLKEVLPVDYKLDEIREMILLPKVIQTITPETVISYAQTHNIRFIIQHYWTPSDKLLTQSNQSIKLVKNFSPFKDNNNAEVLQNFIYPSGDLRQLFKIRTLGPYIDVFEVK